MWVLCFFVKHFFICCCKKSYSQATCILFHTIHCSYTYMTYVQDVNMFVPMIKHSYLAQYILFSQVAVLLKDHYCQCHIVCAWRWQNALSVSNHNTLIVHFSLSIYIVAIIISLLFLHHMRQHKGWFNIYNCQRVAHHNRSVFLGLRLVSNTGKIKNRARQTIIYR